MERFSRFMNKQKGQILMMSVIVIGLIVLLVTSSLAVLGLTVLNQALVDKNVAAATALNYSCAEEALFKIRQNQDYIGSGRVTINEQTCYFSVNNIQPGSKQIVVSTTIQKIIRRLVINLTVQNGQITINSWQEI